MNGKAKNEKNQVKSGISIFEQEEVIRKAEEIRKELQSRTRRELETAGKFKKDEKLSFVTDDMLIVGCDIGSESRFIRAKGNPYEERISHHMPLLDAMQTASRKAFRSAFCY